MLRRSVQLRAARRRPGGQRAGAPDRRRAHAARLSRQRPRSAAAGAGRPTSARRSTCIAGSLLVGRQPARLAGAAAQARARLQRAQRRAARRRGLGATDFSLAAAGARACSARCSARADERHASPRACSTAARRRRSAPAARSACPSCTAACRRRSGASSTAAATSRRCAASCSATTSTAIAGAAAAPRRLEPRRHAQPRARRRRRRCSTRIDARAGKRGGLSEEARAHLADSADTLAQALAATAAARGGLSDGVARPERRPPAPRPTAVAPPLRPSLPARRRTVAVAGPAGLSFARMTSASAPPRPPPALQAARRRPDLAPRASSRSCWRVSVAALLNPIFVTPFAVLLGRTLFIAWCCCWSPSPPPAPWQPRAAAALAGAGARGGARRADRHLRWSTCRRRRRRRRRCCAHEGRVPGFICIAGCGAGDRPAARARRAVPRARRAGARPARCSFALERSTLERQALDARLTLLQAQIEPHFLFNTLANVQALVESRLAAAAPVLKSLIAYLRAAMPRLHDERADAGQRGRAGARLPGADADAHARPAAASRSTSPPALRALRVPADGAADAGRERGAPRHRPERGGRPHRGRRRARAATARARVGRRHRRRHEPDGARPAPA